MAEQKKPTLEIVVAIALVAALVTPVLYVGAMGFCSFLFGSGSIDDSTYVSVYGPYSAVEPYLPDVVGNVVDEFDTWLFDLGQGVAP